MSNSSDILPEQAVLGCLLNDNSSYEEISHLLKACDFSIIFHQQVYVAISKLIVEGKKADIICVSQLLKDQSGETNDESFIKICEIAQSCYAPGNIKAYAAIVRENSIDRSLINASHLIIEGVKQKKENRLDYAQECIAEIINQVPSEISSASDILIDVIGSIDERHQNRNGVTGISTGYSDFDILTHGLHRGDLIILAGRPSMGKTLLAMNIAEHIAIAEEQSVIIFSLEMSKKQLVERSLISVARLSAERVKTGTLDSDEFSRIAGSIPLIAKSKLFIDDQMSATVSDLRAKCRRVKREHGLSLVIVDYITLMAGNGENETIRISNITRGLKQLARDLDVPVMAISQLNRSVESRQDKRPTMADLRQSGAIEQDADLILFIYRDEVYNKSSPRRGVAEVIIAKHRNGSLGEVNLAFDGNSCRFSNCDITSSARVETSSNLSRKQYVY